MAALRKTAIRSIGAIGFSFENSMKIREGTMKIRHVTLGIFALCAFYSVATAEGTVTNAALGISAYLPNNWIASQQDDSSLFLSDTTYTYRSQIVVKKHVRNTTDFPVAGDWTRAHLLVANYSYDPFGAVLYFDSSAASKQDSLWAPEAFSEFFSLDTSLNAWSEYIRFTETGTNAYELYAIGDTADMKANIGMYMGMIRLIHIVKKSIATTSVVQGEIPYTTLWKKASARVPSRCMVDLLGKRRETQSALANGIYYRPESGRILLKVK
jgi:hypothetical protein